jgi:tetratricopeptide (TPR) repeat protein
VIAEWAKLSCLRMRLLLSVALLVALPARAQPPNAAQAVFLDGKAALEAGQVPEAIAAFQKAAKLVPRSPAVHFHLAAALLALGVHAPAVRELRLCLRLKEPAEGDREAFAEVLARLDANEELDEPLTNLSAASSFASDRELERYGQAPPEPSYVLRRVDGNTRKRKAAYRYRSGIAAVAIGSLFATAGIGLLGTLSFCGNGEDAGYCYLALATPGGLLLSAALPLLIAGSGAIVTGRAQLKEAARDGSRVKLTLISRSELDRQIVSSEKLALAGGITTAGSLAILAAGIGLFAAANYGAGYCGACGPDPNPRAPQEYSGGIALVSIGAIAFQPGLTLLATGLARRSRLRRLRDGGPADVEERASLPAVAPWVSANGGGLSLAGRW